MNGSSKSRFLGAAAALGFAALPLATPSSAHAWWSDGVFVGVAPPVVVGPPVGYPPPDYVPPTVYSAPPEAYQSLPETYQETPDSYLVSPPRYQEGASAYDSQLGVPPGRYCYAGPHICPLASPLPAGRDCSCPSYDGGWVGGQAG